MIDVKTCFTYAYSAGTSADFYQTVTAAAASTNIIDLDNAGTMIVSSKGPWLCARVGAAFVTCVSINIALETDSDSGFATTNRIVSQWRIVLANLAAGALVINQQLPVFDYQRYLRAYFTPFTDATLGTIAIWLSDGPETAVTDFGQTVPAS
jgi:hypothetical protein